MEWTQITDLRGCLVTFSLETLVSGLGIVISSKLNSQSNQSCRPESCRLPFFVVNPARQRYNCSKSEFDFRVELIEAKILDILQAPPENFLRQTEWHFMLWLVKVAISPFFSLSSDPAQQTEAFRSEHDGRKQEADCTTCLKSQRVIFKNFYSQSHQQAWRLLVYKRNKDIYIYFKSNLYKIIKKINYQDGNINFWLLNSRVTAKHRLRP